jgi:hypothetical protein
MKPERFVFYCDILGFKNLVLRGPLEKMVSLFVDIYSTIGRTAIAHASRQADAISVADIAERQDAIESSDPQAKRAAFESETRTTLLLMSDSVVIYSEPLKRDDARFFRELSSMVRIARKVLETLLDHNLPSRGALSFGEFYVDAANSIYVGKALVEAYELAESQEWIGAVIGQSLTEDLSEMNRTFPADEWQKHRWLAMSNWDYLLYDVPVKKQTRDCESFWCKAKRFAFRYARIKDHCRHEWCGSRRLYVANWATSPNAHKFAQSELFAAGVRAELAIARKYRNTLSFLEHVARTRLAALTLTS